MKKRFSDSEIAFLKDGYKHYDIGPLTKVFNTYFRKDKDATAKQIYEVLRKQGIIKFTKNPALPAKRIIFGGGKHRGCLNLKLLKGKPEFVYISRRLTRLGYFWQNLISR